MENCLSYTKNHNIKSSKWTGKLRGSLIKLGAKDAKLLTRALTEQKIQKVKYALKSDIVTADKKKASTRDIGNKLHDRIEILFSKMGFHILESDYNRPGPDIAINDPEIKENTKILIQCKKTTGEKVSYSGLGKLIREYATWVREKKAKMAILVLSGYKLEKVDRALLEKNKVVIWTDGFIDSYEKLVNVIGKYAKYQLFSDLGLNYKFGDDKAFDAFEVSQNKKKSSFFVFKANPEWLLKSVSVLRRLDWGSDVKGYQRILEKRRLDKLSEYFQRDDWSFPNTLIFTINPAVHRLNNTFSRNKLNLPSIFGSLWIMDGQHRLYGFSREGEEARKNNDLVCVLFDPKFMGENSDEKQANIFIDINMNVKKVSTSLLLELLQEFNLGGVEHGSKKLALEVVTKLSGLAIFKNLISGYSRKGGPISLTTFVTDPAMQRLVAINGPLIKGKNLSTEKRIKKSAGVLRDYFLLVAKIFSEEWGKDYFALSSDKGIRGLLRLLLIILDKKGNKGFKEFSTRVLKALKNSGFDFGYSNFKNNYAGGGGAILLVNEWLELVGHSLHEFSEYHKKDLGEGSIPKEEDDYTEFKSSLRWNLIAKMVDKKELEKSVLKTINAFLNTDGGQLFIGIDDKRKIIGLNTDYKSFKNGKGTRDDFRLHLSNLIREQMGESVMDLIHIKFGVSKNNDFCLVKVDKSPEASFMGKEFYYRASASSILLEGEEMFKYISRHWKNQSN